MERRLAAILAADVVGYSRLMGEDETGTLAHLGRIGEARAALNQALAIKPDLSSDFFRSVLSWKDSAHLEHYTDGLRKAGLPE